ncbi:hypothetical protein Tco_1245195 [Tanacetum coccineum]
MAERLYVYNAKPFIFDIDGRTLEYGREDFCLITGFLFGKVNLDPDEEDHSEFRMRVFPKIENLKGEHLLELVNKDVKFAKLDDEDDGLETFSNSIHWWCKDENVIPYGVAWSNGLKFEKSNYDKEIYSENSTVNKLIPSAIEMNELWVHSKEEVHVPAVEKKDIQERDELLKTVKEQKQMIIDLQVRLNSVEEKLKLGPSDVDHLDKTDNLSKNASDCGLDQQSMGGVSQCMNVDKPYKNDVLDNFHADGLDHKLVEGVSHCTGLNDEYDSVAVNGLISLRSQDVGHLSKVQDACVSELLDVVKDDVNVNSVVKEEIVKDDVNVNSLVKEDIEKDDVHVDSFVKEDIKKDDVQFDSVVKDAEQIENETLPRQKFPGKAYLSPYIQPSSTEVKCRKRRREIKLEKVEKKSSKLLLGRMELKLNCYHGKRKHHNKWQAQLAIGRYGVVSNSSFSNTTKAEGGASVYGSASNTS